MCRCGACTQRGRRACAAVEAATAAARRLQQLCAHRDAALPGLQLSPAWRRNIRNYQPTSQRRSHRPRSRCKPRRRVRKGNEIPWNSNCGGKKLSKTDDDCFRHGIKNLQLDSNMIKTNFKTNKVIEFIKSILAEQ